MGTDNKKEIVKSLCETLRLTRDQEDLVSLDYEKQTNGEEIVTAIYDGGGKKTAVVTMDSGIAMIRDILRAIR